MDQNVWSCDCLELGLSGVSHLHDLHDPDGISSDHQNGIGAAAGEEQGYRYLQEYPGYAGVIYTNHKAGKGIPFPVFYDERR